MALSGLEVRAPVSLTVNVWVACRPEPERGAFTDPPGVPETGIASAGWPSCPVSGGLAVVPGAETPLFIGVSKCGVALAGEPAGRVRSYSPGGSVDVRIP